MFRFRMMSFLRAAIICGAMTPAWADANDWPNYRHDTHRSGAQRVGERALRSR